MTAAQTLAQAIDPMSRLQGFDEFWSRFREMIAALPARWHGAIDAGANQVIIPSLDRVRVVGRLLMPECSPDNHEGRPHGLVITTHGYAGVPEAFPEEEPWTARGLATLRLRVRGYPPSTIDMPDLRPPGGPPGPPTGWIMHRIESPDAWILRGAVADVVQTIRCARTHFGNLPIALHGESLGGGLAVIAAAQLRSLREGSDRAPSIDRLVLALPSLGDWRWRAGRYCNGAGREVNVLLDALRGRDQENLLRTLLLFDAALHAAEVDVPCLCQLAERDDVVPAPSAAAIFNALASVQKWRFVTRYGHFEGGIAAARQHAAFERLHPVFADPAVECGAAMARDEALTTRR